MTGASVLEAGQTDRASAQTFLDLLAGEANAVHCFQTYADNPAATTPEGRRELAKTIWGRFSEVEPVLRRLNEAGASICVAVNRLRERAARRTDNVLAPRACWHENDGGLPNGLAHVWPAAAPPSMVVQTRPGHHHFYWLAQEPHPADAWSLWTGIGRHMIARRGSDPKCLRREQVLRVPGFLHQKDPLNKHRVTLIGSLGGRYSLGELAVAFPAPTEAQFLAAGDPIPQSATTTRGDERDRELSMVNDEKFSRIVEALWTIDPDESREKWVRCLMALESTRHPERQNVGEAWSRGRGEQPNAKYVEGEPTTFMRSFREGAARLVSVGTIIQYAREAAMKRGAGFADMLPGTEIETAASGDDWSVSLANEMPTVEPMHEWVIPNLLVAEGMHTAISGEPGVGKSSAVFGVMAALATSTAWLGSKSPILRPQEGRPLASVYLDLAEGTPAQIGYSLNCALAAATVRAGGDARDRSAGKHCAVLGTTRSAFPLIRTDYGVLVPDKANLAVLRTQLMRAHERLAGVAPVRAVIVDNLARFLVAASENEPGPVLQVFDLLATLLADVFPDAGIVWVAHPPKSNETAVRGSGAIFGALRGVVRMVNCHSISRSATGRLREGMTLGQRALEDAGITATDAALAAHRLIYHDKSNFSMRMIEPIIVRREGGALIAVEAVQDLEEEAKQRENLEALAGWLSNPINSVEEYPERKLIGLMAGTRGQRQLIPMPHRLLGESYEQMLELGVRLGYLSMRLKAHGSVVSKLYSAGPRFSLL